MAEPQLDHVYKFSGGRYGIYLGRGASGKTFMLQEIDSNLTFGNLVIGVRKLVSVPPQKVVLLNGKLVASMGMDPLSLPSICALPNPELDDDEPDTVYRLLRPDENVYFGLFSKNPLSEIGLNYHLSGTRTKTPFISTSVSGLWPLSFAKSSLRSSCDILCINSARVKGDRYRLDNYAHCQYNLNLRDPRASSNAYYAREITFEAYLPPDSFSVIHIAPEMMRRLAPVRNRPTLERWVSTLDADCQYDLSDLFGGLAIDDLM